MNDREIQTVLDMNDEIIKLNNVKGTLKIALEMRDSRIAALEAQNKKLVEALENSTQCLEAWKLYHSRFFDKADESAVTSARALLSEVTK